MFSEVPAVINYNMRCIEIINACIILFLAYDKLQHEMYWNRVVFAPYSFIKADKLQHEMYWNAVENKIYGWNKEINYNMRCIEIGISNVRSIWTRDKLQHEMYWNSMQLAIACISVSINYTMRCIEILVLLIQSQTPPW